MLNGAKTPAVTNLCCRGVMLLEDSDSVDTGWLYAVGGGAVYLDAVCSGTGLGDDLLSGQPEAALATRKIVQCRQISRGIELRPHQI